MVALLAPGAWLPGAPVEEGDAVRRLQQRLAGPLRQDAVHLRAVEREHNLQQW